MQLRVLRRGDEVLLERFLVPRTETSMFLRSNMAAAGLDDRDEPLQGTYVAAIEQGDVAAVAAHYWNANIVLQAPTHVGAVVQRVVAESGRPVHGMIGPLEQVLAARDALGIEPGRALKSAHERLLAASLHALVVPEALASGRVRARAVRDEDIDLMTAWRVEYLRELLLDPARDLVAGARRAIELQHQLGGHWVLVDDEDRPLSYSAFNARIDDVAQIGGVYTPPPLRGRGYARCVVAGQLLDARAMGVRRAVLFTGADNLAAQAAYRSIGFGQIGEFGLLLLSPDD